MSALTSDHSIAYRPTILVVEDDRDLREALADTLELSDFNVKQADCAEIALHIIAAQTIDMVVSDVNMGEMDGHQLLDHIQAKYPHIPVLLVTAYASVSRSVEAIRNGAVDYLVKPFEPAKLVEIIKRHVIGINSDVHKTDPIAEEESSKLLLQLSKRVAATDSTVLISGESGTGKEVLARYIHNHSQRAQGPFIAINCAAIPENMLESTLFGHEKGAFTGAYASAPGKFEQANGGTILLDEISEMDIGLQAKLLRVLQEKEVERVGGRKTMQLDVRVIATTNRRLLAEVSAGRFREDLYYRLSVFPLEWRALRERTKDIMPLAQRLLQFHAQKMHRKGVVFDESARSALLKHRWPGNVRELDNVVQRALIMQPLQVISESHLRIQMLTFDDLTLSCPQESGPEELSFKDPSFKELGSKQLDPQGYSTSLQGANSFVFDDDDYAEDFTIGESDLGDNLKRKEFSIIIETLKTEHGSRKNTAEKLGISPRTLRYKLARMRDFGIDVDTMISV